MKKTIGAILVLSVLASIGDMIFPSQGPVFDLIAVVGSVVSVFLFLGTAEERIQKRKESAVMALIGTLPTPVLGRNEHDHEWKYWTDEQNGEWKRTIYHCQTCSDRLIYQQWIHVVS